MDKVKEKVQEAWSFATEMAKASQFEKTGLVTTNTMLILAEIIKRLEDIYALLDEVGKDTPEEQVKTVKEE